MIPILGEDIYKAVVVGLTPGQTNGRGVKVLLEESLQLGLRVILLQTNHLRQEHLSELGLVKYQ